MKYFILKYSNRTGRITILLLLLALVYGLTINLTEGPNPIHEWRKTDSLALTQNYMKGEPFLSPKTNLILENGNRNAVAEFPIIYYLMGKLWSVIGQNELIFRLLSLLIILGGIVAFHSVVYYYLKSEKLTLFFSIFLFSSPILLGYAHGFIPNPFAYAFMLYAGYFAFKFIEQQRKWAILGFFIFSTLAVLIKITSILAPFAFAGAFIFYALFHRRDILQKYATQVFLLTTSIAITIGLTTIWYTFARDYNAQFGSPLFSTVTRPIWEIEPEKQQQIFEHLIDVMLSHAYHRFVLLFLMIFALYTLVARNVNPYFKWLVFNTIGALVSYFILWFWVFDVHDYYLIEILFVFAIFFFILLKQIQNSGALKNSLFVSIILYLFIIFNVLHANFYSRMRFSDQPSLLVNNPFINQNELDLWRWIHHDYMLHLKKLREKATEIQNIIPVNDTLFCISDNSPNTHLYTLNRIGYSNLIYENFTQELAIRDATSRGAQFMLFLGGIEEREALPYSEFELYNSERIYVFDLRPYKSNL